ncbi:MAG: amidohydrolase family protein [Bacillota bacterium]|nr:amidohydrolase family protein [Bacillota bacterium]
MTEIIPIDKHTSLYIWAPGALVGSELLQTRDILIKIENGIISSLQAISYEKLPVHVYHSPNLFSLERGQVLMPSLIDAHVHLALGGDGLSTALEMWRTPEGFKVHIIKALENTARAGVGVVRDGGDSRGFNLHFRDYFSKRKEVLPQIVATGEALRRKEGYGSFLGHGYDSPEEIPFVIERLSDSGIDQLKIVLSGVVSFNSYGSVEGKLMPFDELQAIIGYANKKGLKTMAHASSDEAVELAVQAGVDSVEHGYFVKTETLKKMADKQVSWIPTVIPVAAQARNWNRSNWSMDEVETIEKICEEQVQKIELAFRLGVPLGMGTDSGAPGVKHGEAILEEIKLYVDSGIPVGEVLKIVTSGNASLVGLGSNIGTIARGMKPALMVINGDPLQELDSLKNVERMFIPIGK